MNDNNRGIYFSSNSIDSNYSKMYRVFSCVVSILLIMSIFFVQGEYYKLFYSSEAVSEVSNTESFKEGQVIKKRNDKQFFEKKEVISDNNRIKSMNFHFKKMMKIYHTQPENIEHYIKDNNVDIAQSESMLALYARSQQKLKHYNKSNAIYKYLMDTYPANIQWLFGFAVSLEQIGKIRNAYNYYKKIIHHPNIEYSMRSYILKRINAIERENDNG